MATATKMEQRKRHILILACPEKMGQCNRSMIVCNSIGGASQGWILFMLAIAPMH
jgi:hypothetical protein